MTQKQLVRNNIILMSCLLILIVFLPAISAHRKFLSNGITSAIIISSIFVLDFSRRTRNILTGLGVMVLVLTWLSHFLNLQILDLMDYLFIFSYMVFITVAMVSHIARRKDVTAIIIISAVNGYLLLGYLGALLLAASEILQKFVFLEKTSAIHFAGNAVAGFHDYIYFSFVTLTTLGYGDVTPVSYIAKSFTLIIAIFGQLYVTILIAMLVGKFLARSLKE